MFEVRAAAGYDHVEVRAAAGYDHGYNAEVYPVGDEEGVRESGGHEGRFQPPVGPDD